MKGVAITEDRHPMEIARLQPALAVRDVELFSAEYVRHTFGRHAHSALAIGVVDDGLGEFWCRGRTYRVPRDALVLIAPNEPHTGGIARDSTMVGGPRLSYRMLYLDVRLVESLSAVTDWCFPEAGPLDAAVARRMRAVYDALLTSTDRLLQESNVAVLLGVLHARYGTGGRRCAVEHRGPASASVMRAREYLDAHYAESVSLLTLAGIAGLNPSYLNRAFRSAVGLPPHAYVIHRRVERARVLLRGGASVASVAQSVGFSDQSKLTRHFKRAVGVPPGQFRAQIGA